MNKRQHNTFSFFMPGISFMNYFCVLSPTWCATLQDVYCVSCKQSFMLGNSLNFFSIPNGSFKGPQIFFKCSFIKRAIGKFFCGNKITHTTDVKNKYCNLMMKLIKQIDSKSSVSIFCNSIGILLLVKYRYPLKKYPRPFIIWYKILCICVERDTMKITISIFYQIQNTIRHLFLNKLHTLLLSVMIISTGSAFIFIINNER